MTDKIDILGVQINATTLDLTSQKILNWIEQRRAAYVCVVPVSTVVECQSRPDYRKIVNEADIATPDGMPLVWLGRFKGNKIIQRTYGPDLMLKLCESGQKQGVKHFFYGGAPGVLNQLETRLKNDFSAIHIAGKYSPPFTEQIDTLDDGIVQEINRLKPDILWVALGSPKQDFWIYKHRDKLEVPVMLGIGAAFDFLSGAKRQAPRWIQNAGLEWLFRLCCEPRRLWRRYLVGNSKFIYYLIKEQFQLNKIKPV